MKNENPTIFYSWQSDHTKTRYFIEAALRAAIKNLAENPDIELAPRFDKDTQGKVGSINIPTTIRKKIDLADVFVADMTLVDEGKSGRAMVNQNVMYELGYAAGKLSDEATVVLLNSDLGGKKLLPFDIAQNRVVDFSLENDKKGEKLTKTLEGILKEHLQDIKAKLESVQAESIQDKLVDAIENSKPARRLAETYFTNLYGDINKIYPGRYKYGEDSGEYYAKIVEAYEKTLPVIQEFYQIISMATEYKKEDVLLAAYKKLENLSKYFDVLLDDIGGLSEASKEYHGLVVYELASIIVGSAAKEDWWSVLPTLTSQKFKRGNKLDKPIRLERLRHFPQGVEGFIKKQNIRSISILIEKRHSSDDDLLQAYIDGSLLMWFLVDSTSWMVYLLVDDDYSQHYQPQFIKLFKKPSFVKTLFQASDCTTLDEFKDRVWAYIQKSVTGWPDGNMATMFASEDIKTREDIGFQNQKVELL
ncbi:MAG TPA: hypothetical protein VK497_01020 [Candidatus Saccharimonadales bacterium]|nr:hypothetical protein [Candidatus Saccharimonadales bacterium]